MSTRQAVILAGGRGTRLGSLSENCAKPMQKVGHKPFLEFLIWNLKRHGLSRFTLLLGYKASSIIDHFGDGSDFGITIDYVIEPEPLGTGGALALAFSQGKLDETFLFCNGDTIFDFNYNDLINLTENSSALVGLSLRRVDDASRYGSVELVDTTVMKFAEKSSAAYGLISGGVTVIKREAVSLIPSAPCSLEADVFPLLAAKQMMCGRAYDGFFLDIGLPETLGQAQEAVPQWRRKKALFLDRDGVLNRDFGYVCSKERFEWVDGAIETVKLMNDAGILVVVVTNQAGIARGFYDELEFQAFMHWINDELRARGAHLDAWYHCPHHPSEGLPPYLGDCECRKPRPGMLERAIRDWEIDPSDVLLVGDKDSDIQAAANCGVRAVLYQETDGKLIDRIPPEFYVLNGNCICS